MTHTYSITCRETGLYMGDYQGTDAYAAAVALAHDAGYPTLADMAAATSTTEDEMLDGYRIVEKAS